MRVLVCAMLAALTCAAMSGPATARSFTVDDLLAQETIGATAIDPSGRWLVFEQRDRYDSAARYDYDQSVHLTLGRLRVANVADPGTARPLLAEDPRGVVLGAFSPSGDRVAVYRLENHTWRLGVVTMSTGAVRWFAVTPEGSSRGQELQWLDERRLLVIDRPDGKEPKSFARGSIISGHLPARWAAAASGAGSHSLFGSGRYLDVRARRLPNRLLRLDVETGASTALAEGQFVDLEASPDGRRVALLESGGDLQPRPDGPVRGASGSETESGRLSILDLATTDRTWPCGDCDVSPNLLSWSPMGRRLLVFVRGEDGLWPSGGLRVIDARTGATDEAGTIRPELDTNPVTAATAWIGEAPAVYGRQASGGVRADWYRLVKGKPQNLTSGLPPPGRSALVTRSGVLRVLAGGSVWQVSTDGHQREILADVAPASLQSLRYSGGTRQQVATPSALWLNERKSNGQRTLIGLSADGRQVSIRAAGGGAWADASPHGAAVIRNTDQHGVTTLTLVTTAGAATVAAVNRGWSDIDPPRVIPVPHTGPTGEALTSWVFLPARADPHLPAPLLVRPYLGSRFSAAPSDQPGTIEAYQNLRVLTGRGYAVLVPSLPNPPGGMRDPAEGLAQRILGITQAAFDAPALAGRLDPDRMALIGFSFGGYSVMTTITQTDCFRAAVAMDGISDMAAYWASLPLHQQVGSEFGYMSNWHTGVVEETQPEFHAPLWSDTDRYIRNSPLFAADRIQTPLLLMHGAEDGIPMAQSEAMYSALFRQGKDALFVVYWGAMHAPTAPGDIRSVYDTTFRFLDDHLGNPVNAGGIMGSLGLGSASSEPTLPRLRPTGCPSASRAR